MTLSRRGRGVAKSLKLETIRWAKRNGYRWMLTSSEAGNEPMLKINERIGYRRLPAVEEWAKAIEVAMQRAERGNELTHGLP